jgi:hypothetical protein
MGLELVEIFAGREGLPRDTFNVIVTQGGVKASNQAFFAEWLAQKIDRSGLENARSYPLLGISGNEDDRYAMTLSDEIVLKIGPVQARHLHIRDQA